jgi:hypothetical protein
MKAMRQIEAVELMIAMGNFSTAYAKALLAATRQSDLAQSDKPKKVCAMTPEQMARMGREMITLNQDFRALEASYGDDVLQLVISAGYVSRLIGNKAIEQYLEKRQPEMLEELRGIVSSASLEQTNYAPSIAGGGEDAPRWDVPDTLSNGAALPQSRNWDLSLNPVRKRLGSSTAMLGILQFPVASSFEVGHRVSLSAIVAWRTVFRQRHQADLGRIARVSFLNLADRVVADQTDPIDEIDRSSRGWVV